jgi:acyl-[acyl-carrier-protein]-phospholipid O-acyltransferase/long-chain-fatty-acid--[acyl-carrier-protein] ligase
MTSDCSLETQLDRPPESRGRLMSRSFLGLLTTQFLGATNDNILRWLVIGVGKQFFPESVGMILGAGTACFVLPYLLLAAPAGYLGDRFSKRTVIVSCKLAEIVIMIAAIVAILLQSVPLLFLVVAAMGAQSALFGPSKLGSIPEMLPVERISAANGLIGLTTVMATVIGMGIGNWLADVTQPRGLDNWWLSALILIGVAAAGTVASLSIKHLPAANPRRLFPWNFARQTYRDLASLAHSRPLLRVAFGTAFFWSLGALAQMNIDQFAFEGGATEQTQITPLLIALVVGVGIGSVLAGYWSGGRVELGILPLGAGGVAISSILLFTVEGTLIEPSAEWTIWYAMACLFLMMLGLSAGLFDVPLAAYMQHRSPVQHRGSILAANNFMTFSGILLAAGLFTALRTELVTGTPLLSSRQIFLLCGVFTIPVFVYIVWLIPQASIRFLVWLATHTICRVRVHQWHNLPEEGGALLVANHVSWLDGVLLLATSSRPIRLLIDSEWVQGRGSRWLARTMGAIPVRPAPKAAWTAISVARKALDDNELVCIFPEGVMTRSGQLQAFKPGLMAIVRGTQAPLIPVYLDELAGSIFSYRGGKSAWWWPWQWPIPVSIWFGPRIPRPGDVHQVRQAVQDLGAEAVQGRAIRSITPPRAMLRACRAALFRKKVADSSGAELTGGSLLMRALIVRRVLQREVLGDEPHVGILLPPSVGGVVVNAAVALAQRIAANLNYTLSSDALNACLVTADIRHVLTSRKVTEKLDLSIDAEVIYMEDLRDKVTLADKIIAAAEAYLLPASILERLFGLHTADSDDVLTVIFTSGSAGDPKGVLLIHHNIASNVEAIDQTIHLRRDDTIVGILPFFHSFGYTVTLWGVLNLDLQGIYHFSPIDARAVGKLCRRHHGTVMLSAPTFLRAYLKRCPPEDFASLDVVVTGAERLPPEVADAFEKRFGTRPIEGYGTTELSPVVSVNVPPSRTLGAEVDRKEGSVGRPMPGISAKTANPDTLEDLPAGETGMLLIKGPNVMKGYLGMPEKTAEVIRDGWYVTGDVATIDRDGFIRITGRLSRFSKIGGEMVPHVNVEQQLQELVADGDDSEMKVVVTSVPDARKGERLVVLHTQLPMAADALCRKLAEAGMPNLWIPSPDSFHQVPEIPLLGSGKLDLRSARQQAEEVFSG